MIDQTCNCQPGDRACRGFIPAATLADGTELELTTHRQITDYHGTFRHVWTWSPGTVAVVRGADFIVYGDDGDPHQFDRDRFEDELWAADDFVTLRRLGGMQCNTLVTGPFADGGQTWSHLAVAS